MYQQIELPYAYDALEPHIDAQTVEVHYTKHHKTYTDKINELAQNAGIDDKPIEVILAHWKEKGEGKEDAMPIRNNGGGFYNHNLYFAQLSPSGGGEPGGELAEKIDQTFGSFEEFKEQISQLAKDQFGSGYAWLSSDAQGNLSLSKTLNQDNPILESEGKQFPILAVDVWEHSYYLKYQNKRPDYIEALFEVIDWEKVAELYQKVQSEDSLVEKLAPQA